MQSTGQTGTHFRQPLHSSGTMITSMLWLKIAPNCSGQWRRHASQLMHSDISIRNGTFCHFGLRSCVSMRSSRVFAATAVRLDRELDRSVKHGYDPAPFRRSGDGGFAAVAAKPELATATKNIAWG